MGGDAGNWTYEQDSKSVGVVSMTYDADDNDPDTYLEQSYSNSTAKLREALYLNGTIMACLLMKTRSPLIFHGFQMIRVQIRHLLTHQRGGCILRGPIFILTQISDGIT